MLTAKYRQEAINWLNGKRDFKEGVAILKDSGYKPGVVRRLETIGESDTALMHLQENIYQYIQFVGAESVEDTDADLGVINGQHPEVLKQEDDKALSIEELSMKVETGECQMPVNASKAIIAYGKFYRQREKAHRLMKEVPETNEAENVEARRKFSDTIDSCTSQLEKLYPLVSEYLDTKKEISEESLAEALEEQEAKEEDNKEDDGADEYDTLSKEKLQKLLKSAKTKIIRKKNMLEYQQETKAGTPNPLPECPKRVKYETEIAKLEKEVEALQYAIARKA